MATFSPAGSFAHPLLVAACRAAGLPEPVFLAAEGGALFAAHPEVMLTPSGNNLRVASAKGIDLVVSKLLEPLVGCLRGDGPSPRGHAPAGVGFSEGLLRGRGGDSWLQGASVMTDEEKSVVCRQTGSQGGKNSQAAQAGHPPHVTAFALRPC